jgi:ketosteroid isomerase-like protein
MNAAQVALEVRDRLEIADAIYRFGAGIDFASEELFVSAFAPDAIVDVTSSNKLWGLNFPVFQGIDAILQVFKNSVFLLDTTHAITNPRIQINGDTAKLYVVAEAQHLPPSDHSRHCLMKSQYDVSLVRDGDRWVINHLIINGIWFTGETIVLMGK